MEHHRSMGKSRRQRNVIPQKTNNSIEDLVRNEVNEYSVPDLNRTMINITMNPMTPTKNLSKKKLWMISLRNSWRSYKTQ
jgi:hypothetical protein